MIPRRRGAEIVRYLATGALSAGLNVVITLALTEWAHLHYLLSLALASLVVIAVGFVLNRQWTFRVTGSNMAREFVRYALVTGVNVPIGMLACGVLVEVAGVTYPVAIVLVAAGFAPLTYLVHRLWTFGLTWMQER